MTAQDNQFASVPQYHVELVRDRSIPYTKMSVKQDAIEVMHTLLDKSIVEQMVVAYISASGELVGVEVIATGQMTRVSIGMTEVFRGAILAGVDTILLCHNHPTGDPSPSPQDLDLTTRVIKACEYMGMILLDHIVIAPGGKHFSIKDNSQLLITNIMNQAMEDLMKENRALPPNFPDFGVIPKPTNPYAAPPALVGLDKLLEILKKRGL